MKIQEFIKIIKGNDIGFASGVPDSQLKALCDYLIDRYGVSDKHIIAANEGNAVALAAGYHLATGEVPIVYLQNSGIGNIANPVLSLLHPAVYGIPCIFIIGWRGEPGTHDEPQHIAQGNNTLELLKDMGIETYVITKETTHVQLQSVVKDFHSHCSQGESVAYVIGKGALEYDKKINYSNSYRMSREDIIKHIVSAADKDIVISTTGKISRELFIAREIMEKSHHCDFLTVGSMGHSSSIALGVSLYKPMEKVWCIDGDGAVLMHMGAMAVIGTKAPKNMVHLVINNGSHESVGGMPTVADKMNLVKIAEGCGYPYTKSVDSYEALDQELMLAKQRDTLSFIEIKAQIGSREDLGRPTSTAADNKVNFMNYLQKDYEQ